MNNYRNRIRNLEKGVTRVLSEKEVKEKHQTRLQERVDDVYKHIKNKEVVSIETISEINGNDYGEHVTYKIVIKR